jgi:hypothetical protein
LQELLDGATAMLIWDSIPCHGITKEKSWLAEGVFKYNVCYYFGMSIDLERDNFLVRDENTLGCLLIYRKPGGAQLNPPEDKIACPLIR